MNLKEFIQYLFNQFKFWVVVNEWDTVLHLRNGKIRRELTGGIFLKIPILDGYYGQPNRQLEVTAVQINCVTKDGCELTISMSALYRITSLKEFYLAYSEPNEVISALLKNALQKEAMLTDRANIQPETFGENVFHILKNSEHIGYQFENALVTSMSFAMTLRIIKDDMWEQRTMDMKSQHD